METVLLFRVTNHNFEHTSLNEVANTIKNLKNYKALGDYRIPNNVLTSLLKGHIVAFCNIINAMIRLLYIPEAWKEAAIDCIPKQGKPLNQASSYRTITSSPPAVNLQKVQYFVD